MGRYEKGIEKNIQQMIDKRMQEIEEIIDEAMVKQEMDNDVVHD